MGIGGGSGGGGFKLEKTWRATGVGTTTFNSPGNFTIPFGKYEVLVSGRAGTGNPNTPGTISGYNPIVPSTVSGSNPTTPSNISGYNAVSPGNPTGVFNAGSGGNFAGYTQSGGNVAGYNAPTGGGFNVTQFVSTYDIIRNAGTSNNPTGTFNPPSGGNIASYNTFVAGSANYNAYVAGSANYNPYVVGNANYNPYVVGNANYNTPVTATIYRTYLCEPAGTFFDPDNASPGAALYVDEFMYNSVNANYDIYTNPNAVFFCPTPSTNFQLVAGNIVGYNAPSGGNVANYNTPSGGTVANYNPPTGGNVANYNTPSGGNANFNSLASGTQNWNAFTPGTTDTSNFSFTSYDGFSNTCPSPFTYYQPGPNFPSESYSVINFACTPVPGSPGNINYNAVSNTPVFNAFVSGSENYNSATGGSPNYNAAVSGNLNYNAVGGQNANFNTPAGGVAGDSTNVLGVFFPGGNAGSVAPFVSPTLINRYIADDTTYPVNVPTGAYVTIQSK